MRRLLLLISFNFAATLLFAQAGKLKKADNYYNKVAYDEAASLYSELIGSEVDSPELKLKLADCYYQTGETELAEQYYSTAANTAAAKAEDVYKYAQTLKENGKYQESDVWMEKFHNMNSVDLRGLEFSDNRSYVSDIEKQLPYFTVENCAINTPETEFGGYISKEGKLYFVSNRRKEISVQRFHSYNGLKFLDLFSATINPDNGELNNVTSVSRDVNKKFHEGPMCFSPDGKMVYYTQNNMQKGKNRRDNEGIQNLKLFRSSIDEKGNWNNEQELDINSKDYSVGHPSVSSDGKTLYFASDMPGGFGGADLYKMEIKADGTYGKPENLGNRINTEGQEMFPWISSENLLFFASDGHLGLGGLDVFVMIPDKQGAFNKRINLGKPVNSPKDDFALIMNEDDSTGYVSSNREGGRGDDDIYSFVLLRPLRMNLMVKGIVSDRNSHDLIPGAKVDLYDSNDQLITSVIADQKGYYEMNLEPDMSYRVVSSKEDYFNDQAGISTLDLPEGQEEINQDLLLEKDPGLSLYTLITDSKTKEPLAGVHVTIVDNSNGEEFLTGTTNESGDVKKGISDKKINERVEYGLTLSKEGYFEKTVVFSHLITESGEIRIHEILAGALALDPVVTDLSEMVQINPINFDLNKYNIRKDAAVELDKIVEIMNKYPNMVVELGSHTDCRGSRAYNEKLSDKRAKASAAYIKTRISDPDRIYGKGYGESRLLNGCECEGGVKSDCSEEEHAMNRRTEFKVISTGDDKVKVENTSTDSFKK